MNLEEPYYYVFLVDVENNKVKAMFPYLYEQNFISPSCGSIPATRRNEFYDWNYYDYQKKLFGVPLEDEGSKLLKREDLMGDNNYIIKYSYNWNEEGPWEIWVYLFENNPKRRGATTDYNEDNYPVEIKKVRFNVGHMEQTQNNPLSILSVLGQILLLAGLSFSGLYKILKKYWIKIKGNWKNNRYTYVIISVFFILTIYFSYYLCPC